ncbi:MAG: hypothetical protein JNK76_15405, partial [Planctomycetales bacterium]|nr:hypothetical protein [Planctomycetales bacterium]
MPRSVFALVIFASLAVPLAVSGAGDPADHDKKCATEPAPPHVPSAAEARGRALVLHETFEAALHALHHHYYREDEG